MDNKRILVFGTGVIGSIYAGRLSLTGHDVSVLARNRRLIELQKNGLKLFENGGKLKKAEVSVISELKEDDIYDYVFVILRKDHLKEALPLLDKNKSENFVFMVNTPNGYLEWIDSLGKKRVVPAFPGAGGKIENGVVYYSLTPRIIQPTTLGEIDGKKTPRVIELKNILKKSGFPVSICSNMDSWQKSHVAMVCPLAYGIYYDGGNNYTFSKNSVAISQMNKSLKETFGFLKKSKIGIRPPKLNMFRLIPLPILNSMMKFVFNTKWAETVISNHALSARYEMEILMNGFLLLAEKKGFEMKELKKLIENGTQSSRRLTTQW